jgi:hypothetical protein
MQALFAVIRSRGAEWDASQALESQRDWRAHADFMNGLHADGFVVLGGPLEGTTDTLLIVRAKGPEEIERRLQADPWDDRLLQLVRIAPWTLRLGALG